MPPSTLLRRWPSIRSAPWPRTLAAAVARRSPRGAAPPSPDRGPARVARNLVEGRGLVSDALWSYQTAPLQVPRAAFEVWQPLPSLLAAVPIAILGVTNWFRAAQVVSVVTGSLLAVLAWRLGADVATELALPPGRARTLAAGSGLVAGLLGPLVVYGALPIHGPGRSLRHWSRSASSSERPLWRAARPPGWSSPGSPSPGRVFRALRPMRPGPRPMRPGPRPKLPGPRSDAVRRPAARARSTVGPASGSPRCHWGWLR